MKLIIAYVRPERLNYVKQELYKTEVKKISVTNVLGHGQQEGFTETYRGVDIEVELLPKVRIEIGVNDDFVEPTVSAIQAGAATGEVGDGKIFVVPLDDCFRIRSGERGTSAIG